jgi:integrase
MGKAEEGMTKATPMKALKNLRKKGGSWYYDHGGTPRRYEPLGSDDAKALARYQEIRGREPVKAGTVDAMLRDFIEWARRESANAPAGSKRKRAPGTFGNYESWRKVLSEVFGAMNPAHVNQRDILTYLYDCPRMTFANEIALLSMAYSRWMRTTGLTFNPCLGVKCDREKSKRTRLLTWTEIQSIVDKSHPHLALAIDMAIATGLRITDLCELRWDGLESFKTGKTGERIGYERTADFDALLARARALRGRVGSMTVLCSRSGEPWKDDTLRDNWNDAVARAGVKDAVFHDLRAAAATEIDRLYGKVAAQNFLAHRDLKTTERYLRERRTTVVRPLTRKRA